MPNKERIGFVVSITLTVRVKVVAAFDDESDTSYETVYDPKAAVFTEPEITMEEVMVLSSS